MKHFWKDNTGSALIWAVFLMLILMTLFAVVYAGVTVYTKYQACETEIQRTATATVNRNMLNSNVRDLILDVPTELAEEAFYAHLIETGWTLEAGCWNRHEDEKLVYSLEDMEVTIDGKTMSISAMLVIPLPWDIGDLSKVRTHMNVRSSVLYID